MVSEKAKNTLKNLGLTEYESRAYIGLVESGPTTARDLSEISGVPHSRIYDILSKLENRGWIESQSGRPARYRAKSPSEAVRLYRIKQEEKLKEASETIQQELEPLYEEGGEMEKPDVWTIRGSKEILSRIEEMFKSAEIEILVSIPYFSEDFSRIEEFMPILKTKEVTFKLLTSEENEFIEDLESISGVKVKYREPLYGGGVIIDGKEALIVLESGGNIFGIWSDEVGLAKFAEEYFNYLWEGSSSSSDQSTK